ncbi:MAG: hypothetical protein E4H27_04155 [Anaerolineales bacterium]|nr:MAG: hypothetical protein E4H27_04155 [Anaerolineales bacterium]
MNRKQLTIVLIGLTFVLLIAAGCSKEQAPNIELKMAPMADMPSTVRQAPVNVQQAYQFNIANSDIMQQIPCYCGCGAVGHHSNFNCYANIDAAGKMTFDGHALGCSICVDITTDTMRLLQQGQDIPAIQAYVDNKYSQYGPPTTP